MVLSSTPLYLWLFEQSLYPRHPEMCVDLNLRLDVLRMIEGADGDLHPAWMMIVRGVPHLLQKRDEFFSR